MSHTARIAALVGLVVGVVGTCAVCHVTHARELQELQGDLQRAREEFQDTMAESLAAQAKRP
jgi:uncharacterized membrane-anchored protein YhcB (DUF1043 family)